jgi:DNA-binding CsgD family transcriptional regulator
MSKPIGNPRPTDAEQAGTVPIPLAGRRKDATVAFGVQFPDIPPCSNGYRLFCDEAWAGIASKLALSDHQVEIVRRILASQGEKQIARSLGISPRTIETHLERLHAKFEIHCRIELATHVFAAYRDWRTESDPPAGCPQNTRLASL